MINSKIIRVWVSPSCWRRQRPSGSHNVRDMMGAPGYVFIHSGIHGGHDLAPAQFDWKNPVAKITITAM